MVGDLVEDTSQDFLTIGVQGQREVGSLPSASVESPIPRVAMRLSFSIEFGVGTAKECCALVKL